MNLFKEIKELRTQAEKLQLENAEILHKYNILRMASQSCYP